MFKSSFRHYSHSVTISTKSAEDHQRDVVVLGAVIGMAADILQEQLPHTDFIRIKTIAWLTIHRIARAR